MVATTLKMNRKPLNRNAVITQEIRISAKMWWDAVAPQSEQFFFLSASFNGTQSDLHRERLLATRTPSYQQPQDSGNLDVPF